MLNAEQTKILNTEINKNESKAPKYYVAVNKNLIFNSCTIFVTNNDIVVS